MIYGLARRHIFLKREEIGEKIEVFYDYLGKLLGSEQALIIQVASFRRLCFMLLQEYEEVERYVSFS